jgi:hypothetical protein
MRNLVDVIMHLPDLLQIFKIFKISFWGLIFGAILGFCCALPSLYCADKERTSEEAQVLIVLGCTIAGCIGGLYLAIPSGIISFIYVLNCKKN